MTNSKILYSSNPVYSHDKPMTLLKDHLCKVSEFSVNAFRNIKPEWTIPYDVLEEVVWIISLSHDIGKATGYFQEYLGSGRCVSSSLRCHALFSSLFTLYFTCKYLESSKLSEADEYFLSAAAFACVNRHHGELLNLEELIRSDDYAENIPILERQMKNFYSGDIIDILKNSNCSFFRNFDYSDLCENVLECYKRYSNDYYFKWQDYEENFTTQHYIMLLTFFSVLISSDKHEAIFHENVGIGRSMLQNDAVDVYKSKFGKSRRIDQLRENVYGDVMNSLDYITAERRIYSITSPTGSGKTLMSLSLALKIRQKLDKKLKIIYCLPFTSIIDQNFDVIFDVFKNSLGQEPDTAQLLKHHHLADVCYRNKDTEYETDESKFLMENWQSNIIVTTFAQFFESLFSNKNNRLLKFHNMSNSIILLDEIQAIPAKYYSVINEVIKQMADMLNIYFILITATQPLIFDGRKNEIFELLPEHTKYYTSLTRVNMLPQLQQELVVEEFIEEITNIIESNPNKSVLIVLNTISTARMVYEAIKDKEEAGYACYYLSTHIIPKDRRDIINRIKVGSDEPKIIVSTQLMEAGVDMDVDIVVRDLGPLDSINQVAGRCNRNWEKEGTVYIFNIINQKNKPLYSFVYNGVNMGCTKRILEKCSVVEEKDFLNMCSQYFEELKQSSSDKESKKIKEYISMLRFKDVEKNFKLIESEDKVSIFIEKDIEAEELWNEYVAILEIENPFERKKQYLSIKNKLSDYIISVNRNKVGVNGEQSVVRIENGRLNEFYDINTGFIIKPDGSKLEEGTIMF